MSKKKKLYNLRTGIMSESEKIIVLLEQIINDDNISQKNYVLSNIALSCSKKVSKMNEKVGMILKY